MSATDIPVDSVAITSPPCGCAVSAPSASGSSHVKPESSGPVGDQPHPGDAVSASFRQVARDAVARKDFSGASGGAAANAVKTSVQGSARSADEAKGQRHGKNVASAATDGTISVMAAVIYMPPPPPAPPPSKKTMFSGVDQAAGSGCAPVCSLSGHPSAGAVHPPVPSGMAGAEKSATISSVKAAFLHSETSGAEMSSPLTADISTPVPGVMAINGHAGLVLEAHRSPEISPTTAGDLAVHRETDVSAITVVPHLQSAPRTNASAFTAPTNERGVEGSKSRLKLTTGKSEKSPTHFSPSISPMSKESSDISQLTAPSISGGTDGTVVPGTPTIEIGAGASQSVQSADSPSDGPTLRLDTPGWQSALASQAGRLRPGQRLSVRTDPMSLGPIQIEAINLGQGNGLHIHLTANHPDTALMLQQGAPLIAQQITGGGMGTTAMVTVSALAIFSQPFSTSSQGNTRQQKDGEAPAHTFSHPAGQVHGVGQESGATSSTNGTTGFESWI